MAEITAWLVGRLPDDWFTEAPEVTCDRDEIVVVGRIPEPERTPQDTDTARGSAEVGRIQRFWEDTRATRMQIADEAEARFGRKVAWGVRCGDTRQLFTTLSVPVMTRLRQPERLVLDTLVDAGVARSRSDALAWSVRLVGQKQKEWIDELRAALVAVEKARAAGPAA